MNNIILSLDDVEKLIELIKEHFWDHPEARLKELTMRFEPNSDFLKRISNDDPELIVIDLIHKINNSEQIEKLIDYMYKKTGSRRYYKILEKYTVDVPTSKLENTKQISENVDLHVVESKSKITPIETRYDTLDEKIENECKSLVVIEKTRKKFRKYGIISFVVAFCILIGVGAAFPQNQTALEVPQISIPAAIAFMGLLVIAGIYQNKNEKEMRKITGYKKFSLSIYKAFLNMKKFHDERDMKYINKAKGELTVVHDGLESSWGILYEEHPSFLSLEKPIHDFIDVFGKKFIQAFSDISTEDNKIDKSLINIRITTLIHLMEFFYNYNFDQIYKINKELTDYSPKKIPKDKTKLQKLRENTALTKVIQVSVGSACIVLGGAGVSYSLNMHPDSTYEKFVDWSLFIIIPSLIAYIFYIIRRKT